VLGDAVAFLGAVSVTIYLGGYCPYAQKEFILYTDNKYVRIGAGRVLREWMPLFVYAFPVTFLSSIFLAMGAILVDIRGESELPIYVIHILSDDPTNIFLWANIIVKSVSGWMEWPAAGYVAYLAIGWC